VLLDADGLATDGRVALWFRRHCGGELCCPQGR